MFRTGATHIRVISRGFALAIAAVLAVAVLASVAPAQKAAAADLPESILEGGYIISDAEFFDGDSLTAAKIQTFLNGKVSSCSSGYTCLKSYKANIAAKSADKYCKAVKAEKGVSAATIIARVGVACGINPKVIIVMLQKEQGLITSSAPSKSRYDRAMGYNCPDTTGCSTTSLGFFTQVYGGARQLQVYTKNPASFNYHAGQVNTIKWHPSSACGTSKVYIQNQATANLYIYTPYRPNVAALAAGTATGDSCSSYGNRNFYNYYVSWFSGGVPASAGAPAQVPACQVPPAADVAKASGTATVKLPKAVTTLNVRKAPTLACTSGISSLNNGAEVTMTGRYGMWTRITPSTGGSAWVATEYLSLPAAPAPAGSTSPCAVPSKSSITTASGTVEVAVDSLNARTAPSTSCDSGRIQVDQGDEFARTAVYGVWWQITVKGTAYWAHSDYLKVVATSCSAPTSGVKSASGVYVSAKSSLTARKAPSASCGTGAKTISAGTALTRTGVYKDFTRVKAGSATWWVATSTIKAAPTKTVTSALNLRTGPSTSTTSMTVLKKGATVKVIATSGVWRKVVAGSRTGWVHSAYLK